LASDFTKTFITGKEYCYSVDNMKMDQGEALNLKKNLINNSVIRGGKITTIAVNYKDWYEGFKKNSLDYQGKLQKVIDEENQREATFERKDAKDIKNDNNKVLEENIFDLSGDVDENILGLELDGLGLPKQEEGKAKVEEIKADIEANTKQTKEKVEDVKLESADAKELVEAKVEDVKENAEKKAVEVEVNVDGALKEVKAKVEDVKENAEKKAVEVEEEAQKLEIKKEPVVELPDGSAISLDI